LLENLSLRGKISILARSAKGWFLVNYLLASVWKSIIQQRNQRNGIKDEEIRKAETGDGAGSWLQAVGAGDS
jgi:hypothetical protein